MTPEPPLIDDFRPLSMLRPNSAAEVAEIVGRAAAEGYALYPVGGGTMLHLGNPPTKPGHAIDTRALDKVIDYPARDMTITVQAGITIAKLQEVLAKENQRLPVDVPHPETATLGGAIAVNASGPRRYGYGNLRDYVIGISFTDDQGHEVKAGGRVVKNVAGYDLCKLQIGALGTLGIVTQVTLKVLPTPEDSRIVVTACPADELAGLVERVHASAARPACVELLVRSGGERTLLVGFEGNREAVAWQVGQLCRDLARPLAPQVLDAEAAPAEWSRMTRSLDDPNAQFSFRASVLPSGLAEFLNPLPGDERSYWQAHAGNGIVIGHLGSRTEEEVARVLADLRRRAAATQGGVIVTRCPPKRKRELKVWGEPRGDWALMRRVKRELDPRDLFNPGRFVV
jgi:glycolate oxidase FAD binding subunit